ncbi:hypothetical protein HK099_001307 [Clydaea vesicula]|uniref:Glycerophosphocholine acyltransferase 1 n=1 Tax=Clydaea vesicula TaxID=447962 RepID=A0AAD5TU74_9FUNG|nr:hypothetical protein HK099_001307 [Clydaea vesicula]
MTAHDCSNSSGTVIEDTSVSPVLSVRSNYSPALSPTLSAASYDEFLDFDDLSLDYDEDFLHLLFGISIRKRFQLLKDKARGKHAALKTNLIVKKSSLKKKLQQQKTVKLRDKFAFVLGVSNLWITPVLITSYPNFVPFYYAMITIPLIVLRFLLYRSKKWHYFTADLCYVVNFLTVLCLYAFPSSNFMFIATFCLAHGPVAWAIYAWRNSMVFHSVDKMTSIWIHYMLKELKYSHFAYNPKNELGTMEVSFIKSLLYSMAIYLFWQVAYYYFILVRKADKVFKGERATSFTWMLADYMKNKPDSPLTKLMVKVGEKYHVFCFMSLNFIYAILTTIPTFIFYKNFILHTTFLIIMLMMSIFNGADYYIEVFSKRYGIELTQLGSLNEEETLLEATFGCTSSRGKALKTEKPHKLKEENVDSNDIMDKILDKETFNISDVQRRLSVKDFSEEKKNC